MEMEDVKFHQCVRLSRFENDRTISFIPPDGEFELMSYRLNTQVKPLIWVEAIIESHSGSRIEFLIKAKAQFKRRSTANNVEVIIPVPEDADSPKFKVREENRLNECVCMCVELGRKIGLEPLESYSTPTKSSATIAPFQICSVLLDLLLTYLKRMPLYGKLNSFQVERNL